MLRRPLTPYSPMLRRLSILALASVALAQDLVSPQARHRPEANRGLLEGFEQGFCGQILLLSRLCMLSWYSRAVQLAETLGRWADGWVWDGSQSNIFAVQEPLSEELFTEALMTVGAGEGYDWKDRKSSCWVRTTSA
jgi:hypothetical protein